MLGAETLRTATFSRTPDGYRPADVDDVLDALISLVDSGSTEDVLRALAERDFGTAENGYNVDQVDALLEAFEAEMLATCGYADDEASQNAEAEVDAEREIEAEGEIDAEVEIVADGEIVAEGELEAGEPATEETAAPSAAVELAVPTAPEVRPDLGALTAAIERTKVTVSGLDAFIANEVSAIQAACDRQVAETNAECEAAIAAARESAAALLAAATHRAAEIVEKSEAEADTRRNDLTAELAAVRSAFDEELATQRRDAERGIAEMEAEGEAHLARVTEEARKRCDEADKLVDEARELRETVLRSIESARQALGSLGG
jgi:DivIVA domain-containing protein